VHTSWRLRSHSIHSSASGASSTSWNESNSEISRSPSQHRSSEISWLPSTKPRAAPLLELAHALERARFSGHG
jgi:hypothetical protein